MIPQPLSPIILLVGNIWVSFAWDYHYPLYVCVFFEIYHGKWAEVVLGATTHHYLFQVIADDGLLYSLHLIKVISITTRLASLIKNSLKDRCRNPHCLHCNGSALYSNSTAPGRGICKSLLSNIKSPNWSMPSFLLLLLLLLVDISI